MKHTILSFIGLMIISSGLSLNAQEMSEMKLPLDPEVRHGVLDNGMTYYIRHNEEPKDRASFYIIQNVGAVLENDAQNGLAHFLEHMAFNGTKHFPGKGILNTLERHGVAFGRNINAYTSQNETVYNLSDVPVDKPGLLDTCLLVLNDWSNYLLLTEEEIDAERGVITEEWRTHRNARFRMYKESLPYMYNHSKYAERDVIGDIDVIKNFEYETIRDFYHDWYRTDLQAIAIVGDFDAAEMEKKVIERFSDIPAVEDAKERPFTEIPDNEKPMFALVTDEEADNTYIQYMIRQYVGEDGLTTVAGLRDHYIEQLFNRMMSQRFQELLQQGDPPFVNGSVSRRGFARGYDALMISAMAKTNEEAVALKTVMEEAERARRHGFTAGELERSKTRMLTRMEKRYNERDKISNDRFAREYRNHFLQNEAFLNVEHEFQLMKELMPTITTGDFDQAMDKWFMDKNQVLIIQGPEDEEINHLSKDKAFAIMDQVEQADIQPYEDTEVAGELLAAELEGSSVTATKELSDLDAVEWTLANGARVVYRFADFDKDNVSFQAVSDGGSSIFDAEYVPTMDMLPSLAEFYGLGEFDRMGLQKMLTGKNVSLELQLSELTEGMKGNATPKDIETLMQMIYMRFQQPRFDPGAHDAIMARYEAFVQNMNKNPQKIVSDSLTLILADHHPRARVMNEAYIADVDFEMAKEVYQDRFRDAADFTFFFVGNIEKERMKSLAEKYIGSIPSENRSEDWIDRNVDEPEGKLNKEIPLTLSIPKSTVVLAINNKMDYNAKNAVALRMIKGILDLRYVESIREEEGGTYGVMTRTSLNHYPEEKGTLMIMFDTDPEKADHLKSLVYKELEVLASDGPSEEDLNKTKENLLKDREQDRENNSYWLNMIRDYYRHGIDYNDPENYDRVIESLTAGDIRKVMKRLYSDANVVDLEFYPDEQ